jgi:hypothetical protein
VITAAMPPSDTGQQSSSRSGSAIGFDAITSSAVIGVRRWASGCSPAWRRITTARSARSAPVTPNWCM